MDQIEYLHQQATQISAEDLRKNAQEKVSNLASEVADSLYNEAKRWALKKLNPGDLNLP